MKKPLPSNILYAQSGGATAVINVTAAALLGEARKHPEHIKNTYAAAGGITGVLNEELYDVTRVPETDLRSVANVPGAFFGTCRYKLQDAAENDNEYRRIYEVFKEHNIGYFFYNGGNDSQDTSNKIARYCEQRGMEVCCIGIPKTIDNDLIHTDTSPGFGSAAKYLAVSLLETSADVISICGTSTKVFIMETMGRDSGWLAGSGVLIKKQEEDPPHITLVPERPLQMSEFLNKVDTWVKKIGYCVIVTSEGLRDPNGNYLHASQTVSDDFGHQQLGGVGIVLAQNIKSTLGYKYQLAIPCYMQRAAGHLVSNTDYEMAQRVGTRAVQLALEGKKSVMVTIERLSNTPFRWETGYVSLDRIANYKKTLPDDYLTADGYNMSAEAYAYYAPLIRGEQYPAYQKNGIPAASTLSKQHTKKQLPAFS